LMTYFEVSRGRTKGLDTGSGDYMTGLGGRTILHTCPAYELRWR
jgi:hypothetical protein